ncbi:MAG: hypothetical protein ACLP4R_15515 [Solirubrobacteraceae bacterium]
MSPHLHYEIARVRQNEIAARTLHAHHTTELRATAGRRTISRVGQAVAAVGACLAATAAVTVSGAFANQRPVRTGGHISASQMSRDIRALEAKGYTPYQCTPKGTLMRNSRTGRFELIGQ